MEYEKSLNFNRLWRGLDQNKYRLMRLVLLAIMKALQEKAIENYKKAYPGRYLRNDQQPTENPQINP